MKPVLVIWGDAVELDSGPWVDRDGASKPKAEIFHQVGYVFEHTSDGLTLTAAMGEHQMAPRTFIPAGMILKLVELVEGEPVKIPKRKRAR